MIRIGVIPWLVATGIFIAAPVLVVASPRPSFGENYQVTVDAGEVRQGEVIRPCVKVENLADVPVRVYEVGPKSCGGPVREPVNTTVEPGETKVIELPLLDTREFSGPVSKSTYLGFTSPQMVAITAYASCGDVDR